MRIFLPALFLLLLLGCGKNSDVPASAPRIVNVRVEPQVICVGSTADILFTLTDPNDDEIVWGASLSTGEHGGVSPALGNVPSGATVTTRFDAATSGRHSHQVKLKIVATDIGGLQAQPVEVDLFVFNC